MWLLQLTGCFSLPASTPPPPPDATVALNYQSEGRMLQLNRAKFSTNGNCGYVLKPKCMCQGKGREGLEPPASQGGILIKAGNIGLR